MPKRRSFGEFGHSVTKCWLRPTTLTSADTQELRLKLGYHNYFSCALSLSLSYSLSLIFSHSHTLSPLSLTHNFFALSLVSTIPRLALSFSSHIYPQALTQTHTNTHSHTPNLNFTHSPSRPRNYDHVMHLLQFHDSHFGAFFCLLPWQPSHLAIYLSISTKHRC